jgi:hypothetical protein
VHFRCTAANQRMSESIACMSESIACIDECNCSQANAPVSALVLVYFCQMTPAVFNPLKIQPQAGHNTADIACRTPAALLSQQGIHLMVSRPSQHHTAASAEDFCPAQAFCARG